MTGTDLSTPSSCTQTSTANTWKLEVLLSLVSGASSVTQIKGSVTNFINPFSLDSNFRILISYFDSTTSTLSTSRYFPWMDTLTTGFVPSMTLSVPTTTHDIVGK